MALSYLRGLATILPESQRRRLEELLSGLGINLSAPPAVPQMSVIPQTGLTNPTSHSTVMASLRAALTAMFALTNASRDTLDRHRLLRESQMAEADRELHRLNERLDLLSKPATDEHVARYHESFVDDTARELDLHRRGELRTNRWNEILPSGQICPRDPITRSIHLSGNGLRINLSDVGIRVLRRSGGDVVIHSPITALTEGGYWGETQIHHEPVIHPKDGITAGAWCEIQLDLPTTVELHELILVPFGALPLEVHGLWGTGSPESIRWEPLLETPVTIMVGQALQFPSMMCNRLKLLIAQPHGIWTQPSMRQGLSNFAALYREAIAADPLWETDQNLPMTAAERHARVESLQAITDLMDDFLQTTDSPLKALIDLVGFLTGPYDLTNSDLSPAIDWTGQQVVGSSASSLTNSIDRHLEYTYGIQHLEIRGMGLDQESVYTTKTYSGNGSIIAVQLETEHETHPGLTDIEYYITFTSQPHEGEWLPIMPTGIVAITGEFLQFKTDLRAGLRFVIDTNEPVTVYCDRVALANTEFTVLPGGRMITISPAAYLPNATYTIAYTPDQGYLPAEVSIPTESMVPIEVTETFQGTARNGIIALRYHPYVDLSRLEDASYWPIQVSIAAENGIEAAGNSLIYNIDMGSEAVRIVNRTDYTSPRRPNLEPYVPNPTAGDPRDEIQFYHQNQFLIFTETFRNITEDPKTHGEGIITVTYRYLAPEVRLKAILRRDTATCTTPRIHSYTLYLRSAN